MRRYGKSRPRLQLLLGLDVFSPEEGLAARVKRGGIDQFRNDLHEAALNGRRPLTPDDFKELLEPSPELAGPTLSLSRGGAAARGGACDRP